MVTGDWWTMGSEGERVPGDAQGPRSSNKVWLHIPICSPDPGSVKGVWFCSCLGTGHSARKESLAAGHNRGKGRKWATISKEAWRNRVTTGGVHPVGWRVPGQASREEQQQKSISWQFGTDLVFTVRPQCYHLRAGLTFGVKSLYSPVRHKQSLTSGEVTLRQW